LVALLARSPTFSLPHLTQHPIFPRPKPLPATVATLESCLPLLFFNKFSYRTATGSFPPPSLHRRYNTAPLFWGRCCPYKSAIPAPNLLLLHNFNKLPPAISMNPLFCTCIHLRSPQVYTPASYTSVSPINQPYPAYTHPPCTQPRQLPSASPWGEGPRACAA